MTFMLSWMLLHGKNKLRNIKKICKIERIKILKGIQKSQK